MRKILSFVLVLSLVLGSFSFAFAAPAFSDVDDENVLKAVKRLNAFGIVDGYEDGTYRPERTIKRSEFAKLLVTALGLDNAAQAAMGSSQFSDIAGNEWFAGYVEVAAGQGLVKGYPDGTFRPENTVTYGEAITMLVRALGYKDEWLPGSWPGNYIAKAAELDITKKVSFSPSGLADRGSVAVLLNNTLDAKVVLQVRYGDNNDFETRNPLLYERLKIRDYDDVRVVNVPKVDKSLKNNEVQLDRSLVSGKTTYKIVQEGLVADTLFGLKGTIYLNDDDEIVYVELAGEKVVYDKLDKVNINKDTRKTDLVIEDETYDIDANAKVYINSSRKSIENLTNGLFGKIVFNEYNDIVFMDLYDWDYEDLLVNEVNVDKEKIVAYTTAGTKRTIDLRDVDAYKFVLNNEEISLEDVEADDVLYVVEVNERGDDVYRIFVVRDVVEGKLEKITNKQELVVGGKKYKLVADVTTFSLDDNDKIKTYSGEDNVADLEDAIGENVQVILDITGKVRHIRTDVGAAKAEYGIIHRVWAASGDMIRLFTSNDEEVTYEYDDDEVYEVYLDNTTTKVDLASNPDSYLYHLVNFKVNKDGEISEMRIYTTNGIVYIVDEIDKDDETITINGNKYFVDEDTVFFEVDNASSSDSSDREKAKLVKWDDIKNAKVDSSDEVKVEFVLDGDVIEALVFVDNFNKVASDIEVGVVTDRFYDGDWKAVVSIFDGEEKEFKLKNKKDVAVGDIIEFKVSGKELNVVKTLADATTAYPSFKTYSTDNNETVMSVVYGKSGSIIEVAGGSYRVTGKTLVYEYVVKENGSFNKLNAADLGDIATDDVVVIVFENKKKDIKVVYVFDLRKYKPVNM